MVASQTARRANAVAAAALMMTVALPFIPGAEAQIPEFFDLAIERGAVSIVDADTQRVTHFLDSGESGIVTMRILNYGSAVEDIPVFVWFEGYTAATGRCISADFEAGENDDPTAWTSGTWTFPVPYESESPASDPDRFAPGGFNITVRVNQAPPSGYTFRNDAGTSGTAASVCPPTRTSADLDAGGRNREANAYFVKDLRQNVEIAEVRWCGGTTGCATPLVPRTHEEGETGTSHITHFRVRLDINDSWTNPIDFSYPCATTCTPFPFKVNVTLTGGNLAAPLYATPTGSITVEGDHYAIDSQVFNLRGRAGNYTVTTRLDWSDDNFTHDNTNVTHAQVEYADYVITPGDGWKTDPEDPYPFVSNTLIGGTVRVQNLGNRTNAGTGAISWRAWIDDGAAFSWERENATLPGGADFNVTFTKVLRTDPTVTTSYLSPGVHTLNLDIDRAGAVTELNESNLVQIPIYIEDSTKPHFLNASASTYFSLPAGARDYVTEAHPHELFYAEIYATDDDTEGLSLVANFTNAQDPNATRTYEMHSGVYAKSYVVGIRDLPMVGNGSSTTWTLRIEATDATGNRNVSGASTMKINEWPVHSSSLPYLVRSPAEGEQFCFNQAGCALPRVQVMVRPNMTGFANQWNNTPNLAVDWRSPDNKTGRLTHWTSTDCPVSTDGGVNLGKGESVTDPWACDNAGIHRATLATNLGAPGVWNLTINITDISGMVRSVNRSIVVTDLAPSLRNMTLSNPMIDAGKPINVTVLAHDDYRSDGLDVYANFTRIDGYNVSFLMTDIVGASDGSNDFEYRLHVTTGRGGMLGNAGNYSLSFHAKDNNGNWGHTTSLLFLVNDTSKPVFDEPPVADPPLQEINSNVTFTARATDDTNVTMQLQVRRQLDNTRIVPSTVYPWLNMTLGPDGTYTTQVNFSVQDTYVWTIRAIDSANNEVTETGQLVIRQNLGPRFDIRSPAAQVDGQRYGTDGQRIEVIVYDNDGLDPASLQFLVDSEPAAFDILPPPQGVSGYTLLYTRPKEGPLSHGATVTINLSATDNSTPPLNGTNNFTYRVDATPPVVQMAGFEPRHRDDALHIWNVSLDTRFAISAHDDDGLPTRVDTVRYRVYGSTQSSAEVVYSGPFRLGDVPGLTARPGTFQIQFFAEDAVGNINRELQTLTVYLDATPPSPDPFGEEPDGRDISLTLYDDRSGMDRAVVWHRINNATYGFTVMTPDGETWRATLPEGRKGDVISYYIQAWDRVNNTATFGTPDAPYDDFDVPNHKPTLVISSPIEGGIFARTRDVTWTSDDLDGDALVFTISIKSPGSQSFSELSRIETPGRRTYSLDTTQFGDGEFVLRISVTDGSDAVEKDVTFTIRNKVSAIGTVAASSSTVLPGEATLVTAQITKADPIGVEARVYEDGEHIETFTMRDDGQLGDVEARDGIWSALVALDDAGDYRIDVVTRYREDGIEKDETQSSAAAFSVALTPGYIMSEYTALVALLGLAGAAAIGVAGYMAFRRRP